MSIPGIGIITNPSFQELQYFVAPHKNCKVADQLAVRSYTSMEYLNIQFKCMQLLVTSKGVSLLSRKVFEFYGSKN